MSSEIYLLDSYANNTDSIIHRASYSAKTIFTAFTLLLIIFTSNYLRLLGYILLTIILILAARLPLLKILKIALYPLIFGAVFALSQLSANPGFALIILLRVFATVLLMVWFAASSGFSSLFSAIPSKTLRNTFLLTYRFFFMTIDSFSQRLNKAKVRGIGRAPLLRRLTAISEIIAHQLIHSIEKAERVYRIMLTRGFSGKISRGASWRTNKYDLIFVLSMGGAMLIWII